jgi:hypothetical protein
LLTIAALVLLVVGEATGYFLGWIGHVAPGTAPSQQSNAVAPSTRGALPGTPAG